MKYQSEDEAFMRYIQTKKDKGKLNSYVVLNEKHRDSLVYHAKEIYSAYDGLVLVDIALITAMMQGLKVFPALLQLTMSEAEMMDIIVEQYNQENV